MRNNHENNETNRSKQTNKRTAAAAATTSSLFLKLAIKPSSSPAHKQRKNVISTERLIIRVVAKKFFSMRFKTKMSSREQAKSSEDSITRTAGSTKRRRRRARTVQRQQQQHMNMNMHTRSLSVALVVLALATCWAAGSSDPVIRPTVFADGPKAPQDAHQPANRPSHSPAHHAMPNADQGPAAQAAQHSASKIQPSKSRFCTNPNGLRTDSPLGLESGAVDDLALSASSHSKEGVGPQMARLNQDISGGAWCPSRPISNSNLGKEWIQVKLNRSYVVSAIETQGRFSMGSGKEFVPSYQVEYSRDNGRTWHKWKDFRGASTLKGNEDTSGAVKNELSPPIVAANVIRILPFSQQIRTVCLRFELHGCPYDEGAPVAYEMMDGVVESRWGHFMDYIYDGLRKTNQLSKGLGQLADGVKGPDNFSVNTGFEWVGWKSMNGDVIIEFTFKTLRNFTGALFHSNNLFSAGVEVFQAVDVQYGIDVALSTDAIRDNLMETQRRRDYIGSKTSPRSQPAQAGALEQFNELLLAYQNQQTLWSSETNSIEYEPDKKSEASRPVTVHLKNRLANKLRFTLKFASKWILLSEVEFSSHPIELMSLATADERETVPLMAALLPAKTYDQYVAIIRENQLRRIATNDLFKLTQQPPAMSTDGSMSDAAPSSGLPSDETPPTVATGPERDLPVSGPSIPATMWQQPDVPIARPETNPWLNPTFNPIQPPFADPGRILGPQSDQSAGIKQQTSSSPRTIGLATVISLILVAIIMLVGLLFAISSYKLRHHHKHSQSYSHQIHAASSAKMGLQNFMSNVFSSASNSSSSASASSHVVSNSNNNNNLDYNSIFASHANNKSDPIRAASTLKRLATLSSGKAKQPTNQLLVSIKDGYNQAHHTLLYNQNSHNQNQLIVGLNQANPLAQQQIYNNSHCNNSNQTYATHYSTSMSMASSSTNGGHQSNGDYAGIEYAVPDVPATAIAPLVPTTAHQHHLAFSKPSLNGFQTELRSSHRMLANNNTMMHHLHHHQQQQHHMHHPNQPALVQSQQQRSLMSNNTPEHNYELVYGDSNPIGQFHHRTLSNQCNPSQQQQPFSSMTLSSRMQGQFRGQEESSPGGSSQTTASTSANSQSSGQQQN